MSLPLPAVIVLSVCLPLLAIMLVAYIIIWYRDRPKDEELEEGTCKPSSLVVTVGPGYATSETELLSLPTTARPQSGNLTPIPCEQLPAERHLHILIYTLSPFQWLSRMNIHDPIHARIPIVPRVEYSFYFNPCLMAVNQDGGLEVIEVAKVKPRSIKQFCAQEAGIPIETEIDGIIAEFMTDYQQQMVHSIARPMTFPAFTSALRAVPQPFSVGATGTSLIAPHEVINKQPSPNSHLQTAKTADYAIDRVAPDC
ncbi:hypothetical protein B0T10DRAFT_548448 [Thelonectria olida]|uniref:Uncharacterized protein n=1 Tax=Thelonectria olida TaxID=1576542 RepID=A0A9P8W898_9HYPO|nr:hypothetical protein B0T10DRAFT_548448 [Thelonectria olida]